MELTFKKDFDLTKNTLQHRIVLDAIELLKDKENYTSQEITSMVYLAILQHVCEEDVIELISKEEGNTDFWEILENVIEPKVEEALGDNKSPLYDIVYNVESFKNREMEMNGKFFYAVKELIKQLGDLDTKEISDIIVSMNSLRTNAKEAVLEDTKEKEVAVVNEKMQELINKFKTAK